ncbi:MAG: GNAT family N-acetyltransferase [Sulfitobacter sp.]
MSADAATLMQVCEATWPPAKTWLAGPFTCRDGAGGGKRVSAATANAAAGAQDIDLAEAQMRGNGQDPLFQIRPEDAALDALLAARGYAKFDEVVLYTAPIASLTDVPIPRVTAFAVWEPLAIMAEIWAAGGVGPERIAVMARAACKTGFLARWNEKPAGTAFAGVHGDICMVHAVEIVPAQRRQGVAQWLMRAAAFWGSEQGATEIAVICVAQNAGANALYQRLGFTAVGGYHYRIKE